MKNALLASLTVGICLTAATTNAQAQNWKDHAISPVSNPLFFEDPLIHSEIRPLFVQHNIDSSFATKGGNARVYAIQLRYALTERLALIATKDGYIEFNPKAGLKHAGGFGDLAAGVKYALIDKPDSQFILTPGVKVNLPTGNQSVFQGTGKGEWDVFASTEKGFGDFHLIANVGLRLPNDWDANTAQAHYSLQADYYVCQYFIPFANANAFTILSNGKGLGLTTEGFDLINFGSSNASGRTMAAVGGGFRSRLLKDLDMGFAYEVGVTTPHGLFGDRFTVDFIWRF